MAKNDESDNNNFKKLIQDVIPLNNRDKKHYFDKKNFSSNPKPSMPDFSTDEKTHNIHLSDNFEEDINSEDILEHFDPGISHKIRNEIKTGKLSASKTIDLHGCYLEAAKSIFLNEIQIAYNNQIKLIIFIHGKGRNINSKPILKNAIYHWAKQHPLILGFCTAPKNQGGAGATIIYLKKNKNSSN